MAAINSAISVAEYSASYAAIAEPSYSDADDAANAAAANALSISSSVNTATEAAATASYAAAAASSTAAAATYTYAAVSAASTAGVKPQYLCLDYDRLLRASQVQGWTDATPVSPLFFPPIEDDETPGGDSELVLEIEAPDGATAEEIAVIAKQAAEGMDDLHRAFGGHGIVVSQVQIEEEVPALAPVGGCR